MAWNDQEGTLNLGRYAQVIQTTGTDWRNVQLELRTGRPLGMTSRTQERPKLHKSEEVAFGGYCANVQWVNSGLRDDAARAQVLQGQAA